MKYLLDTSICIYLIKQKPAHVLDRFRAEAVGEIGISVITVAELQYGVSEEPAAATEPGCVGQVFATPGDG